MRTRRRGVELCIVGVRIRRYPTPRPAPKGVRAECGPPLTEPGNDVGLSWIEPERRKARIWVRDGLTWDWQHRVVVHELVHIGIAAGRWRVPAGRLEEDFALELEDTVLSGGTV